MSEKEKGKHEVKPSQEEKKPVPNKKEEIYLPIPKMTIRQHIEDGDIIKMIDESKGIKFKGKKKES